MLDACKDLEGGLELVLGDKRHRGAELVDDKLEPELGRLVLDDKEQFVVVLGAGERALGGEQGVELEVGGVVELAVEIGDDAGGLVGWLGHGDSVAGAAAEIKPGQRMGGRIGAGAGRAARAGLSDRLTSWQVSLRSSER